MLALSSWLLTTRSYMTLSTLISDLKFRLCRMSFVELGWRKFNFFNREPVIDPADKAQKFNAFKVEPFPSVQLACYLELQYKLLGSVERRGRSLGRVEWNHFACWKGFTDSGTHPLKVPPILIFLGLEGLWQSVDLNVSSPVTILVYRRRRRCKCWVRYQVVGSQSVGEQKRAFL